MNLQIRYHHAEGMVGALTIFWRKPSDEQHFKAEQ